MSSIQIAQKQHVIAYKALPTAAEFHASGAFVRGVMGPIGSGKSSMCVWELFRRATQQEPHNGVRSTRWAIIRNTYPELKDTTLTTFLQWIPEKSAPGYSLVVNRQPPMHAVLKMRLPDGTTVEAEFIFLALDAPEDVKKVKSLELTGCWINEAVEIDYEVFEAVLGRLRRWPQSGYTWSGMIMDSNPCDEGEDNWWYLLAEIRKPENFKFWKQPPALLRIPKKNPKDPNEPQMYQPNTGQGAFPPAENVINHKAGFSYWMDLAAGASEDYVKVYILGEYGSVMDGKPVYPEYFDELHLAKDERGQPCDLEVYRGLPLILGFDFGRTPCVVFAQLTPNGQLRIIDELISKNMGIREFARDIVKPHLANFYHGMRIISIGDPAGESRTQISDEQSCLQELANAGLPTEMARTNAFLPRREAVAGFLLRLVGGKPALQLARKCRTVQSGFKGKYQYRRIRTTAGNAYSVEPLKNHPYSDCADATQYIAMYAESGGATGNPTQGAPGAGRALPVKPHSSKGWD